MTSAHPFHFLSLNDHPPQDLVRCHQVHGNTVVVIDNQPNEEISAVKADALITTTKRPIGIQTADCLPVLFVASSGTAVAAAHAGWRGLHLGVLPRTVELFAQLGIPASNLRVAIGPAIGPCCFEVNQEVVSAFEKSWGNLWKGSAPWHTKQPASKKLARSQAPTSSNNLWLDLDAIARMQLREAGVADIAIEDVGFCTYCGPGEFASFRRATHEGASTAGRQWSWVRRSRRVSMKLPMVG